MIQDTLHLKAPGNWINDPNGFIFYKGQYHLFYQHFPFAPRWGTMHWGHATSPDLVHWQHQGVALFPTKDYDQNGVFSGSALEVDGRMQLYYSAVRYRQINPEDIHCAGQDDFVTSQAMMISPDGKEFDNWNAKRQIIPVLTDRAIGDAKHTRDPKVWKDGDRYYMVLGSTDGAQGRLLLYRSEDSFQWEYAGQCASAEFGWMLECPDLFRLDGQYFLIGSPMGIPSGPKYHELAMYAPVDFDPASCRLQLRGPMTCLDWGMDFYAPQTTLDQQGRRVLVAWMRMPQPVPASADGRGAWNGMMCLPRVLSEEKGQLYARPHPNLEKAYCRPVQPGGVDNTRPYRLRATLAEGEQLDIGGYRIWVEQGCLHTDRSRVFAGCQGYRLQAATPALEQPRCRLDIFVEPNLVEIFVDEGRFVLSSVVYGLEKYLEGTTIESVYAADPESPRDRSES